MTDVLPRLKPGGFSYIAKTMGSARGGLFGISVRIKIERGWSEVRTLWHRATVGMRSARQRATVHGGSYLQNPRWFLIILAIAGFIVAGPMELFLPEAASNRFGGYAWLLLLAFYGLCLTLIVLLMRPRLVIYNANPEQLRSILAEVVKQLDEEARWAGDGLVLPKLGVQLHVELFGAMRNVQLVSSGPRQNFGGWKRLEMGLANVLKQTKASPNPHGFGMMAIGILLICVMTYWMISDPTKVVHGLNEMLQR